MGCGTSLMNQIKDIIDIDISTATGKNLDEIMEIERASFDIPWSRETFTIELHENEFSRIILARARDEEICPKILGYCCYWIISNEIHITNIAVRQQFRRRGIAKQLMKYVIDEAKRKGSGLLTLEVRMSNESAINLYTKFGFLPVAVREKYYPDNEDALVMSLRLEE